VRNDALVKNVSRTRAFLFEATFADMIERDRRDSTRADSPLKVAGDAIVV